MPKHQEELPSHPTKVMHEDDPVLVRWPTRYLTRQNFAKLRVTFTIITFVLLVIVLAQVISAQNKTDRERNERKDQVNQVLNQLQENQDEFADRICALVDAVPPGNDRIDKARADGNCGAYVPESTPNSFGPGANVPTVPIGPAPTARSSGRSTSTTTTTHTATATATSTTTTKTTSTSTVTITRSPTGPLCSLPIVALC